MTSPFRHTLYISLACFFGLRLVSLIHHLHVTPTMYASMSVLAVFLFAYISIRRLDLGLIILLSEIILGGAGNFLSLFDINLRTWLLGIYTVVWGIHAVRTKQWKRVYSYPTSTKTLFVLTTCVIVFAMLRGLYFGNGTHLVLQDTILYTFILLAFPCIEYMEQIKRHIYPVVTAFLIGTLSMIAITFTRYSAGLGMIHDTYYTWIRDIAGGKVTDLGYEFFRIVSSEHLFIIPILLVLFALLAQRTHTRKEYWGLMFITITILLINFTRIYFLAGVLGALLLLYTSNIRTWLRTTLICVVLSITIFMSISFVASRGEIVGAELIGLKTASITSPYEDMSAATRLLIWPKAIEHIRNNPVLGSGLATAVTIVDPVTHMPTTRTQFDMGYIEMIAELGIIGTLVYLIFVLHIAYLLLKKRSKPEYTAQHTIIARGLFVGIIALYIINLTTPALFQGYGVVFLAVCLAYGLVEQKQPKTLTRQPN